MYLSFELKITKRQVIISLAAVSVLITGWLAYSFWPHPNPIPSSIQSQLQFTSVYPTTGSINKTSFNYQPDQGALYFKLDYQGKQLTITEQAAPPLKNGVTDYVSALSLKPTTQFQSKLGTVYIVNVYTEEHPVINGGQGIQPVKSVLIGQSAMLVDQNTLITARPDNTQKLGLQQWQTFFNSLKVGS